MMLPKSLRSNPLNNRHFRLLWIGGSASLIGDYSYFIVFPWIILQLTNSSIPLGKIMMTAAIPRAVLMLFGGATVDRISPRRVMLASGWMRMSLVAGVAVLLETHSLKLWHLYLIEFAFGTADAFADPAAQAYLPSLVPPEQLAKANSLMQTTRELISLAAPAPVALLLGIYGSTLVVLMDALSFLFIIGALWRLPDPFTKTYQDSTTSYMTSIREGLSYVRDDVPLRSLLFVVAVLNFAIGGSISVGLPVIAKHTFGSSLSFGMLLTSSAVGGVGGSFIGGFMQYQRRGKILLVNAALTGVCMGLVAFAHKLHTLMLLLCLMSGIIALLNVHLVTWVQERVRAAMLGRVLSILMFFSVGLAPFSLAAAGFAINWSQRGLFLISSGIILIVTLLASLLSEVRNLD